MVFIFLSFNLSVLGQEKTFEREYTYKASEADSKLSCRAIVINELRTQLLAEIGVYVESETLLKTTEIGKEFKQDFAEKISTITAGITKVRIINEIWNGETFWMKAAITIDKKSLEESLKQIINDKQKVKELETLREELNTVTKELNNLKKGLEANRGTTNTFDSEKYNDEVDNLVIVDYIFSAEQKSNSQDFNGAIDDLNKAIAIDPKYILAYYKRGVVKYLARDFQGSIQDHNVAIRLNPKYVLSYLGRAYAKDELKRYKDAIEDYNKIIELDGDYDFIILAWAYSDRARDKGRLKDHLGALKDFSMSIENDPNNASTYSLRGGTKFILEDYHGAIEDYSLAIDLKDDYTYYHYRGAAKHSLGDHQGAITDYSAAIRLNPNASNSYDNRGRAKLYLGDKRGGCLDLSKALELGNENAHEAIKKFCN